MSFNQKLIKSSSKYTGSDEDMITYLESLWSSHENYKINNHNFSTKTKNINFNRFKINLIKMSDNLVFRGNFGAYNDKLEKELSLNRKSIVLTKDSCKLLYNCFNDLFRFNQIRSSLFHQIKNAEIFIKHKKNDTNEPSNFRFLSNHHKLFKIIDKFWTNNLILVLKNNNCLPDKNIVKNNFDREFNISIKDLALDKLKVFHSNKKIVMIDLQKAFDNVSWKTLESLLKSNLTRKIGDVTANKFVEQYMFLNTQRVIKYNNSTVKHKKSIATGLPSSTITFSLIIEELIFQWLEKENCKDDLSINTYVDDMFLEFFKNDRIEYLVKSLFDFLEKYNFKINKDKTLTNIDILDFTKIKDSDCYLGLPFADSKEKYIDICIDQFNKRYYNINLEDIITILKSDDFEKNKKEIFGFFNYKFYGLKNFDIEKIDVLSILENQKTYKTQKN